MTDQWQELKETIIELRDNDGTGTQQEVCKFLANLMDVLEKQMIRSENPNKWIPVSERYPEEEGEDYLVCYDDKTIRIRRLYFDLLDRPYFEYGLDIVAWMPLPEPYKASQTEAESEG